MSMKRKLISNTVAIGLINPKYPRNVGGIVRAASCFGASQVYFSGNRVPLDAQSYETYRLPREERMRDYQEVELINTNKVFDCFASDVVPVAVEIKPNSESLVTFEHPESALYIFGPEDGSLSRAELALCHKFVIIPSRHCLNLASAVCVILYDRILKQSLAGVGTDELSYKPLGKAWSNYE